MCTFTSIWVTLHCHWFCGGWTSSHLKALLGYLLSNVVRTLKRKSWERVHAEKQGQLMPSKSDINTQSKYIRTWTLVTIFIWFDNLKGRIRFTGLSNMCMHRDYIVWCIVRLRDKKTNKKLIVSLLSGM